LVDATPKAPNTILHAVSCTSGRACTAVGDVNAAENGQPPLPFVERYSKA
jgi:hypothetical protein